MTPIEENKYLVAVLKQIDNGPSRFFLSAWLYVVVWFGIALTFFAFFQAGDRAHPVLLALVSAFIGILAGTLSFVQLAAKRWTYLRPHIDRDSVVKRISELQA